MIYPMLPAVYGSENGGACSRLPDQTNDAQQAAWPTCSVRWLFEYSMKQTYGRFPVTVHIFLLRGRKVLLLRRFNVVACHPDGNETVVQAAIREAKEEIGIDLQPCSLIVVGVMHRRPTDERVDFFLATRAWAGEPSNQEPDKCDEVAWFL